MSVWIVPAASQAGFDEFQVFEDQIRLRLVGGENGIGVEQFVLANHIGLGVCFLVGLNQLVGLVEPRVLQIVFASFDFGDSKQGYFHKDD